MASHASHDWLTPAIRWLATVLVVFFLGVFSPSALALETLVSAPKGSNEDHHCKCGMHCKGKCCCSPEDDKPTKEDEQRVTPTPVPQRLPPGSIPCLSSSPCQQDGLPPSAAGPRPVGKVASLTISTPRFPQPAGRRLASVSRCDLPMQRASRLDKPPRQSDSD